MSYTNKVKVQRKIVEDARKADPRRTDILLEIYCTSDMSFDELITHLKIIAEEGKE